MTHATIFACSHRSGGNSDHAAALLAQGVQDAGGKAEILNIRDVEVQFCLACGFCDTPGREGVERCVLGKKDQAWELFEHCFTARTVLFASPIYFYHLPSRLKAWIDRGQQFWKARLEKESWVANLPARKAHAVLVAGQPSGDKLFDGARLTLKYFVQNFNMNMASPLILRGLDTRNDLKQQTEFEDRILKLGHDAWTSAG